MTTHSEIEQGNIDRAVDRTYKAIAKVQETLWKVKSNLSVVSSAETLGIERKRIAETRKVLEKALKRIIVAEKAAADIAKEIEGQHGNKR